MDLDPLGSVLATFLWLAISVGFKFYVTNFTAYNATYGAIGGVIVLMLWSYVSSLAVLIGAELNAEIEHASPYGKEPGEKEIGEKKKIGVGEAAILTYARLRSRVKRLNQSPELQGRAPAPSARQSLV